jgi:hypothetical protein
MGNVSVRSSADIAAKWARVTPGRQSDYEAGVRSPTRDWATESKAAQGTYQSAVQAAGIGGRFGAGVAKATTAKWQKKATELGVSRFGPGVQAAQGDMAAGFEPYASTIAGTTLPSRKPRGDPGNLQRVSDMAAALHKKRLSLLGAGA